MLGICKFGLRGGPTQRQRKRKRDITTNLTISVFRHASQMFQGFFELFLDRHQPAIQRLWATSNRRGDGSRHRLSPDSHLGDSPLIFVFFYQRSWRALIMPNQIPTDHYPWNRPNKLFNTMNWNDQIIPNNDLWLFIISARFEHVLTIQKETATTTTKRKNPNRFVFIYSKQIIIVAFDCHVRAAGYNHFPRSPNININIMIVIVIIYVLCLIRFNTAVGSTSIGRIMAGFSDPPPPILFPPDPPGASVTGAIVSRRLGWSGRT